MGKSWLARDIATEFARPVYLNFDNPQDRDLLRRQAWASGTDLLVLDEIHKMEGWKGFLKGVYDTKPAARSTLWSPYSFPMRIESFVSSSGQHVVDTRS